MLERDYIMRMMDSGSIAGMLGNNHQLLVYLKLELEEIDILRLKNEHQKANRLLSVIQQVGRACIAENGDPDEELKKVIGVIDTQMGAEN